MEKYKIEFCKEMGLDYHNNGIYMMIEKNNREYINWLENKIKNFSERSEPPHPLLCADCAFWKPDSEYAGLGNCSNDETMNRLVFGHADMFLISNDFGCINHKRKRAHNVCGSSAVRSIVAYPLLSDGAGLKN